MGCRTGAAWKREPATCVKKRRSDARQAAVAYRIPALAAHGNGRSAIVPARPQRGRHGRVLSTVRREADTRISIVRSGGQTLHPRTRTCCRNVPTCPSRPASARAAQAARSASPAAARRPSSPGRRSATDARATSGRRRRSEPLTARDVRRAPAEADADGGDDGRDGDTRTDHAPATTLPTGDERGDGSGSSGA